MWSLLSKHLRVPTFLVNYIEELALTCRMNNVLSQSSNEKEHDKTQMHASPKYCGIALSLYSTIMAITTKERGDAECNLHDFCGAVNHWKIT